LGTAGFVLGTVVFAMQGEWFPSDWDRMLVYGTSSAMLVTGVVAWERVQGRPLLHRLSGLGDASYSLYLSHVPVMAAAGLVWRRLWPSALPAAHFAELSATLIVVLLAGFASFRLIETPLLRLSHDLPRGAVAAILMSAQLRVAGLRRQAADWR